VLSAMKHCEMMHVPVTGLYAGLLGVIMLVLAASVSGSRMKLRSSIATNSTPQLLEAVGRHGHFIEWVPFTLVLMGIAEGNGLTRLNLHIIGILLVGARIFSPAWYTARPHSPATSSNGRDNYLHSLFSALWGAVVAVARWVKLHLHLARTSSMASGLGDTRAEVKKSRSSAVHRRSLRDIPARGIGPRRSDTSGAHQCSILSGFPSILKRQRGHFEVSIAFRTCISQ
jgi:uncharacterized protein